MATQIPTPFISPGFRCWTNSTGTVSGNGDKVQQILSHSGISFTSAADPSGLTISHESSRIAFSSDPAAGGGSVELTGTRTSPGHLDKYHLLFWYKPVAFVTDAGTNEVVINGGGNTIVAFGIKSGAPAIEGQLAYNVSPSTTGTRPWASTGFGSFGNWYLISMEINDATDVYRLRVYNSSGSLLITVNTSSSVPAGARIRMDSGSVTYTLFNPSDGASTNKFGKFYEALGTTFTDAQIQSIIGAGFGDFVTTPVGTIDPVEVTYTPTAPASATLQRVRIHRGQAYSIQFTPDELQAVDQDEYEARLGIISDGTYDQFSVADGNMTVDEDTGEITIELGANDTSTLSLDDPVFLELWRTDTDANSVPVARSKVVVVETLGN